MFDKLSFLQVSMVNYLIFLLEYLASFQVGQLDLKDANLELDTGCYPEGCAGE